MFNLLPAEYKKEIYKEYRLRFFTLVLFLLSATGLMIFLLLSMAHFIVNLKHVEFQEKISQLERQNPELRSQGELETIVEDVHNKLYILESKSMISPSEIIEKVANQKPQTVNIRSFSYTNRGEIIEIALKGTASTRDSLITFNRRLSEEEIFENVNLPVSDLAMDKELDFSISFSVKNQI